MAKNSGEGYRIEQQRDRYQLHNPNTDRYGKYDSNGNYLDTKVTPGLWKGVEERIPKKPPRGSGAIDKKAGNTTSYLSTATRSC